MAFTFDPIFAADPSNAANVAANAAIIIFDPADAGKAPIALTDVTGSPLPNPITVNRNGFGPAFVSTLDRVGWFGGGFTGFFTSYEGIKAAAVAAQTAATNSAAAASVSAGETVATAAVNGSGRLILTKANAGTVDAGSVVGPTGAKGDKGADGSNVLPTDTAIQDAINNSASATRAALKSNFVPKWQPNTAYLALDKVVSPNGDVISSKLNFTSGATYNPANWDLSATYATPATVSSAVADTGYDVVLLAGQSNMSGRGIPSTTYLDPGHPRVFQLKGKAPNKGTVIAATDPLDMVDTPSGIGPGFQFARQYIKAGQLSFGRKILLVPCAEGGTPLTRVATPTWKPSVTGSLYSNLISQANIALALPGARLVAVLWVQGETDGDLAATGPAYQADLDALITGIRGLTGAGATTAPFIIGGMVPEYLGTGTRTAIHNVQADTPNRKANTAFVAGPTGGELGDGNHYNRQGQIAQAANMFTAYSQLSANVPGNRFGVYTTDAFSTDSTTLVARNTDAVNGGGAAVWSASTANAAFASSGGSLGRGASVTSQFAGTPVPNTKQRVSIKVTTMPVGGGQVYLYARADAVAATNCYRLVIFDTGNIQLQKVVAGTGTNLVATYSAAFTAGATVSLDCDGSNISLIVNGTTVGTAIVDATFTRAGWAGVGIGSTVTAVTLDDFKIESVL